MSSYELRPSVLLKGARGCGKRTIVRSVAAELGVGVMEVSSCSPSALQNESRT
jgi:MoxR-like ATPase